MQIGSPYCKYRVDHCYFCGREKISGGMTHSNNIVVIKWGGISL